MNRKLLRSKMVLFGDTNSTLAHHLELSAQRFSAKINGTNGAEFTQSEINKIKNRYDLTCEDVINIFFS